MLRSRAALAVTTAVVVALCGSIAAAQADSTTQGSTGVTGATGTVPPTVTVNGSGVITLQSGASSDAVTSAYMSALAAALTDAHTKAGALAAGVGDSLGAVQSIAEQSSDSNICSGPMTFARSDASGAPAAAPTSKKKKHNHHAKKAARMADAVATSCTVEADVTVTYGMT